MYSLFYFELSVDFQEIVEECSLRTINAVCLQGQRVIVLNDRDFNI